jgi:hypothetical protein
MCQLLVFNNKHPILQNIDIIEITENVYLCSSAVELTEGKFHLTILRTSGEQTHAFPLHACILSVTHHRQQHTRNLNQMLFLSQ